MTKFVISILTYKPDEKFKKILDNLKNQSIPIERILIINTESDISIEKIAYGNNISIIHIKKDEFDHGKIRQRVVEMEDADILIFFTQDSIVANNEAIENIVRCFNDPRIGCAYGRQLPHSDANPIAVHARLFNYPVQSRLFSKRDIKEKGIKAAFLSNSFAAYRKNALMEVGGFPLHIILSEDMYIAAKMLLANWKVFYCSDAKVYHSHNFTMIEEFKRYFDIGVFHYRERWILKKFGRAEGEGIKYIISEMNFLLENKYWGSLCTAFLKNFIKYVAYFLGTHEYLFPFNFKKIFSANTNYWETDKRIK